jgi:hypothetical protein
VALSLTGRLLCVADQTYMISVTGPTPPYPANPAPSPSDLVGWLATPDAFATGDDLINAALVGETATEIIVAFRGTQPDEGPNLQQVIIDWANDIDALLVSSDPALPGRVHQGFLNALNELWAFVWGEIQTRMAASPGKPLVITGHSKGGGIAPLAAMRCVEQGVTPSVYIFAPARPGDQDFANAYAACVPATTRFEYQDDIVPHLPPSDALLVALEAIPFFAVTAAALTPGYVSVGALQFINWQGQIVGDSALLEVERISRLATTLIGVRLNTIISDHTIFPGSGYSNAICPGVWPA